MAELNMALLLKESLNTMRGKLGKDCTYLAFEKEGNLLFLCAKLKNELGGADKIRQKINVSMDELTFGDFETMYELLNSRKYNN
jgi:hypothetical protein